MASRRIARGLAWFGIGLGLVELFAPRRVAQAAGLEGHETLVAAFGAREIASGIVILAARDPRRWMWTRVVGDALDGVLLASRLRPSNPHARRTALSALAVAPVVVLDAMHAGPPPGDARDPAVSRRRRPSPIRGGSSPRSRPA